MTQCTVGFKFLSCLNVRDEAPECSSAKAAIATMRDAYSKQISQAGCQNTAGQCSYDVSACEDRFLHGLDMANGDKSSVCMVGAQLENCLKSREGDPACLNNTAAIKLMRKTYATQINQDGCGNAAVTLGAGLLSLLCASLVALKLRL